MEYKKILLPDNMSDEAERYIKKVIDYLKKQDKLDAIDEGSIHLLADSFDTYIKCAEIVKKDGIVIQGTKCSLIPHPAIRIGKDAKALAINIMTQMGLTLKSRTKLAVIEPDNDESPLAAFMKNN